VQHIIWLEAKQHAHEFTSQSLILFDGSCHTPEQE
jgi:hypothetical protein